MVYATSKSLDQTAHMQSLSRAHDSRLNIPLTENYLEFLSQNATLFEISCCGLNQLVLDDKKIKCKKPKEPSIKMCTASKLRCRSPSVKTDQKMQEAKRIFNHHAYRVRGMLYPRRFKLVRCTKLYFVRLALLASYAYRTRVPN